MKKYLPVLGCAVAAFGAHAQSTVTIYGNLDVAATWLRNGSGTTLPGGGAATPASTSITRLDSGVGPGSRLGFRGREDLGDGLAAVYTLESGFAVDTGTSQQGGTFWGRQVFVGLQGANWSVTAGRQYAPLNIALGTNDVMGGYYWGNPFSNAAIGITESLGEAAGTGFYGGSARINNSVLASATFGPWTGRFMVGLGNENTRGNGRFLNPSIAYNDGKLTINASVARFRQPEGSITATASPSWLTEAVIGGLYDFGAFKLAGGYYQFKGPQDLSTLSAVATVGAAGASPFAYSWNKSRMVYIGASTMIGRGTLSIDLSRLQYTYNGAADGKSTAFGSVYEYPLSKRTSLYGSYGQISNDARARTALLATISAVTPNGFGSDPKALSLGMRHQF